MKELLKPIVTDSLKGLFVEKFEALIISGEISSGETLLSERELAAQMGISRPVVHEGLLELASKGFVTIKPRSGTVVNDLRKGGSLSLLISLSNYHGDIIAPHIQKSILDMRLLFEVENAKLAAKNITNSQLEEFENFIKIENSIDRTQILEVSILDFSIHHLLAESSGNFLYPLLMNSFKEVYLHLLKKFYAEIEVCSSVFEFHAELYKTIKNHDEKKSENIMRAMLEHGAKHFEKTMNREV